MLFGRNFERGVVGHFPASMIIFFGLQGQVMDIRKQWGWSPNIFLTFPYYPLLSPHPNKSQNTNLVIYQVIVDPVLEGGI